MPIILSLSPSTLSKCYQSSFLDRIIRDRLVSDTNKSISIKKSIENRIISNENLRNNIRSVNELSVNSRRRLSKKINWLVYLSQKRTVELSRNKKITNFQVAFITLKLPAVQRHSHSEITKTCLNNFLNILRKKFGINNYVWRAELQKNGNIHYHLLIDRFIHYQNIRKYWNSSIGILGYLSDYCNKFSLMNFEDYNNYRIQQGSTNRNENKKSYKYGNDTHWIMPNSTDVHSLRDVNNAAAYVCKYLTKKSPDDIGKKFQESLKCLTGRLWGCSQSLSRLNNVRLDFNQNTKELCRLIEENINTYNIYRDYVHIMCFKIRKLTKSVSERINEELFLYAMGSDYKLPISLSP